MSSPNSQDPASADDLLAPPPFGVVESSGPVVLPTHTTMDEVFRGGDDDDDGEFAGPDPVVAEGVPDQIPTYVANGAPVPRSIAADSLKAPVVRDVEVDEPSRQTLTTTVALAVGLGLLLGWSGWYFLIRGGDNEGLADASRGQGSPNSAASLGDREEPGAPTPAAIPVSREDFERLSLQARHALLASPDVGEFDVQLHVGLDLVQADEAPRPCLTFADALSKIEATDDQSVYAWAVARAKVPTRASDEAGEGCDGLEERLANLKQAEASAPAAPTQAPQTPRVRAPNKKRIEEPPADPEPAEEPSEEPVAQPSETPAEE